MEEGEGGGDSLITWWRLLENERCLVFVADRMDG